jgi:transcriptional regulator of met regulon
MTRKEYQKKYQKYYADSGKKSEAAKRYYQKHKFEICDRLREKRAKKNDSVIINQMLGHKF